MGVEEIGKLYIDYSFDNFGSQSNVERLVLGIGVIEECGVFFLIGKYVCRLRGRIWRKGQDQRHRREKGLLMKL